MMCSRCPVCRLKDMRGLGGHDKDGDDDDDNRTCCQVRSAGSSCEAFRDNHCLDQMIIICRKYEQTEEGDLFSHVSQVKAQGRKEPCRGKWLPMTCLLFFLVVFTFLMGKVGKDRKEARNYDADVFPLSRTAWLLGSLLFWTIWLLLRLLQLIMWFIKGLLWFISIAVYPLCCCLSFFLSCVLLLLHYLCDAVYFATSSPVYVYIMCLTIALFLFIFTLTCGNRC
uniref:uncharacterized protein LOC122778141 isoform X1 n=1 Tax=Solea senegalensis TaxID=28829 RepID=UPI001CD84A56|nr:uncharacterized protein LOC122778141 isoform X1 [Solea senegalensis]